MQLIKDLRNGRIYKTKYPIENDLLCHLYGYPFIKANVLSVDESVSNVRCLDKFPYFEVLGNVDGRTKGAREHKYFTWLLVIDEKNNNY